MPTDTLDAIPHEYARSFLPADLAITGFADVEPHLNRLLEADLSTPEALTQWLKDCSEVHDAIGEFGSRVHVRSTLDTTNPDYKKAFMDFVENFEPKLKPITEKLNRKFKDSPAREQLDKTEFKVYQDPAQAG